MSNQDEALSFEQILKNLQSMVQQLENQELGLDEALKLYEEGVKLSVRAQTLLSGAEAKVVELQKTISENTE